MKRGYVGVKPRKKNHKWFKKLNIEPCKNLCKKLLKKKPRICKFIII